MTDSAAGRPTPTVTTQPMLLPRGTMILVTIAAGMFTVAGIRSFGETIGPVFLALVIAVVVSPLQGFLRRKGLPNWLSFIAMLIAGFSVIFAIVGAVAWAAVEMVGLIASDHYEDQVKATQDQLTAWAGSSGINIGDVIDNLDIGAVAGQVTSALSGALGLLSTLSLILLTMLFMLLDTAGFTKALDRTKTTKPTLVTGLQGFAQSTRTYFIVSTVFGLIVAAIDVVILFAFGIPLVLVWGILSLITNYIPNVGFILGLAPPALLAYFEGGWPTFFWVVGLYLIANVVIQSVIQPRFVGDAVGLSTTLTFISLMFWSWVIGPIGAILAVPMTLLGKALLIDIDPTAQWADPLISLQTDKLPPTQEELEEQVAAKAEATGDEPTT